MFLLLVGSEPGPCCTLSPTPAATATAKLGQGSAPIIHWGLMLLMRGSLSRRSVQPQGVATQRQDNLSRQTGTATRALTHRVQTHTHSHTQNSENTHIHTHTHIMYTYTNIQSYHPDGDSNAHSYKAHTHTYTSELLLTIN